MKRPVEFYVTIRNAAEDRPFASPRYRVTSLRQNKPHVERGEVAVKVRLMLEDAVFEEFIPTVEAEIENRVLPPDPIELTVVEP